MSTPDDSSEPHSLQSFIVRLNDDGWLLTIAVMALVLLGGVWSLWRGSVMEQQVRETRAVMDRVSQMLDARTKMFDDIRYNEKIIEDNQIKILEHIKREESQWKNR